MEEKVKGSTNKFLIFIIFALIAVIVVLLLKSCEKDNEPKELKPSGNVDVFEIECNKNCDCKDNKDETKKDETKKDDNTVKNNTGGNTSNNTITNQGGQTSGNTNDNTGGSESSTDQKENPPEEVFPPVEGEVTVNDNDLEWQSSNPINVFTNSMYVADGKIAPGSTNIYQFVVKNSTTSSVRYHINFEETNVYHINMRYRLKKGTSYVVGSDSEWVTFDKVKVNDVLLASGSSDTYYMEWKWVESSNDTAVGEADNAEYSLKINIGALQTND